MLPALEDLLAIQERDTAIDRLVHRREVLPERAALAERERERAAIETAMAPTRARRDEVLGEETRLDREAQALRARAKSEEERLYAGATTSPRELQAMQADIEQLRRHAEVIEDEQLEVMAEREGLDDDLAERQQAIAAIDAVRDDLRGQIAAGESAIDHEIEGERAARDTLASKVPEGLLARYEAVRSAAANGIGIARLAGGTCQGCRLTLPAVEVDRIRHLPEGELDRCEHCGCLLVLGSA